MSNVDLDKGGRIPQVLRTYLGPSVGYKQTDSPVDVEYCIDGGGAPPLVGVKPALIIPDWLTVYQWVVLGDITGSASFDIYKGTLTDYLAGTLPSVSIVGSDPPTVSADVANSSTALTGWTTQINQNDVLLFDLNTISGFTWVNIILRCVRNIGPS